MLPYYICTIPTCTPSSFPDKYVTTFVTSTNELHHIAYGPYSHIPWQICYHIRHINQWTAYDPLSHASSQFQQSFIHLLIVLELYGSIHQCQLWHRSPRRPHPVWSIPPTLSKHTREKLPTWAHVFPEFFHGSYLTACRAMCSIVTDISKVFHQRWWPWSTIPNLLLLHQLW